MSLYFILILIVLVLDMLVVQMQASVCSSKSTCSVCEAYQTCAFLNNECTYADTNSWQFKSLEKSTMPLYCHNSESDDYVYAQNYDYEVEVYSYSNATVTDYQFCEWRVVFSDLAPVTVNIQRDPSNYEEIYLYANEETGQQYYYSKDLTDCTNGIQEFTFTNTTYIRLRVKKVNDLSSYKVTFTQDISNSKDKEDDAVFIIVVVCGAVLCAALIILFLVLLYCIIKHQNKNAYRGRRPTPEQLSKVEFIKRCLKMMVSGKFGDLEVPFEQHACVVCLDEFESNSEVNIVNECKHAFHWKCLNSWFRNIRCDKDLICPHCNVVITDQIASNEEKCDASDDASSVRIVVRQETTNSFARLNQRAHEYRHSEIGSSENQEIEENKDEEENINNDS